MKNTENKTPVEWLVSRLELDTRFGGIFDEIIGQAKEMEKDQINNLPIYCDVSDVYVYILDGIVHVKKCELFDSEKLINDGSFVAVKNIENHE